MLKQTAFVSHRGSGLFIGMIFNLFDGPTSGFYKTVGQFYKRTKELNFSMPIYIWYG